MHIHYCCRLPIHSRAMGENVLSCGLGDVFSGSKIHRLLRLRREGFPEHLSRSQRLVCCSVVPGSEGLFPP